jgi:hypothetical protein
MHAAHPLRRECCLYASHSVQQNALPPLNGAVFVFTLDRDREGCVRVVVILDEKRKAARLAALLPSLASLLRPEMSPTICSR